MRGIITRASRTALRLLAVGLLLIGVSACAASFTPHVNEYTVELPGLTRSYRVLIVNDLHIIADDDPQVNEDERALVDMRREEFSNEHGTADAYWQKLAPVLDRMDVDLIVFAGDMIDYASEQNLFLLGEGLEKIKTPFLYLRADHDTDRWYSDEHFLAEDTVELQEELADNSGILVHDLGEMTVVGWNHSTSQMNEAQAATLAQLSEEADAEKPMVLVTHVPLAPVADKLLSARSAEIYDGRALLWGSDSFYQPDGVTAGALALIYEGKLPVSHVFAAHLHFAYDGPLTEGCTQHVLAPAFEDNVSLVVFAPAD